MKLMVLNALQNNDDLGSNNNTVNSNASKSWYKSNKLQTK